MPERRSVKMLPYIGGGTANNGCELFQWRTSAMIRVWPSARIRCSSCGIWDGKAFLVLALQKSSTCCFCATALTCSWREDARRWPPDLSELDRSGALLKTCGCRIPVSLLRRASCATTPSPRQPITCGGVRGAGYWVGFSGDNEIPASARLRCHLQPLGQRHPRDAAAAPLPVPVLVGDVVGRQILWKMPIMRIILRLSDGQFGYIWVAGPTYISYNEYVSLHRKFHALHLSPKGRLTPHMFTLGFFPLTVERLRIPANYSGTYGTGCLSMTMTIHEGSWCDGLSADESEIFPLATMRHMFLRVTALNKTVQTFRGRGSGGDNLCQIRIRIYLLPPLEGQGHFQVINTGLKQADNPEWHIGTIIILPFGINYIHTTGFPQALNINHLVNYKLAIMSNQVELVINRGWTCEVLMKELAEMFPEVFTWYQECAASDLELEGCLWCLLNVIGGRFQVMHFDNMDTPNTAHLIKYMLKTKMGDSSQKVFVTLQIQMPKPLVLMWRGTKITDDFPVLEDISDGSDWELEVGRKWDIIELSSNDEDEAPVHQPSKKLKLVEDDTAAAPPILGPSTAPGPSTTPLTPVPVCTNCTHCATALWMTGDLSKSFSSSLVISDSEGGPDFLTGPVTKWPDINEDIDFLC
ncbi:hypothetical protein P691DRAFT_785851 [Macrolepiota fuliginosa MF-IS2]|uniref:Uncharacterized protein n=1 Tax=Macrolepiota fuliginosa MF-IS2 TaxID=1400762 RepID=A0A9P5X7V6_9AGAR|nr:hypothetical protein P691DRAFT_785851 [Macrolepiota fuliginosa MF-IS2]